MYGWGGEGEGSGLVIRECTKENLASRGSKT